MSLEADTRREEGSDKSNIPSSLLFVLDSNLNNSSSSLESNYNLPHRTLNLSDNSTPLLSHPPPSSPPPPLQQNDIFAINKNKEDFQNGKSLKIVTNKPNNLDASNKSDLTHEESLRKTTNRAATFERLALSSGEEDDFGRLEGAKPIYQFFERPLITTTTSITRPCTLPLTSCLEDQSQVMASKFESPEDINHFLEEGFQLLSCQEKICDLYVKLHEPGSEELLATFGSIIIAFIEDIKAVVADKVRLGQLYERERDQHTEKVKRMEDEIEGQMRTVEAKIRNEEKKKFDKLNREWKSRHYEEVNGLRIEIEKLKMKAAQSKWVHESTDKLEEELKESKLKNEELQERLNDFMKNYSSLESELGVVKEKLVEKESELVRHKKLTKEDSVEIDNLISQIEVLQTSNKTLHEKTDDLCEALRICRSYYKTQMKQKSALAKDDFIQKYLDESCISLNRTLSREHQLSEIKSNKTYSSGFGDDEDLDSSGIEELENLNSPLDFFNNSSNNNANNLNTSNNSNNNNNINGINGTSSAHVLSNSPHPLSNFDRKALARLSSTSLHNTSALDLNSQHEPERIFKVVLAGDAAVGKSSLMMRLCKNKFVSTLSSTVGVDFQTKTVRVDGKVIALQIWDTAGQERFRSITKSYFRRADGVLLLYDITYEKSFLSVRDWLETIQDGAQKSIPIMLIGNKSDLRVGELKNSCVKAENGMGMAREQNCMFVEASAKSGEHIQEAVVELARSLMAMEDLEVQSVGLKLKQEEEEVKKKMCCG